MIRYVGSRFASCHEVNPSSAEGDLRSLEAEVVAGG